MSIQKLREFEVAVEVNLSTDEVKLSEVLRLVEKIKVLLDSSYVPSNTVEVSLPIGIDSIAVGALLEEYTYAQWESQGLAVNKPTPRLGGIDELKATEMVDLGEEIAGLQMPKIYSGNWDKYFKGTVTWNSMRNAATRANVPFKWEPDKVGSFNVHKEYDLHAVKKTVLYMIKHTKHLNNQKMFLPRWQAVLDRVKELEDEVSTSSDS